MLFLYDLNRCLRLFLRCSHYCSIGDEPSKLNNFVTVFFLSVCHLDDYSYGLGDIRIRISKQIPIVGKFEYDFNFSLKISFFMRSFFFFEDFLIQSSDFSGLDHIHLLTDLLIKYDFIFRNIIRFPYFFRNFQTFQDCLRIMMNIFMIHFCKIVCVFLSTL